ncbi:MAG: Uncharacterized conserved protein UCP033563 [Thermotoga sp. 50_1627]|uniref:DUF1015 domain-containing protein n=1 Tax=Pseudothermotoga sp. TaxID=2033661 RepID=UPI00076C0DC9|nr:MAG: Uncharacterized conserved protein UCP033563 [Thermotoga sp. 50_64]KUK25704.1 MAG: Uncharacterized conserved protein UCP033563 [Thermotoga sp. 50_1627]MBC7115617.1 DUF1015 domain-containing protein [Pseudothermotoga sp.]HBT39965.1 DUF1015 domain-containing protein [Pseudothermotoga sp.]HCO98492.1 DUF1015 domain-containing protein [Pseudothermotoga sp.]
MTVRPFRALRPRKDFAARVAVKPYDVVSFEEAKRIVLSNPLAFYKVTKPEVNFDEPVDPSSYETLEMAKRNLQKYREDGIFFEDDQECFYVYRQISHDHTQTGLVATFSAKEYLESKIKKHELTRKDKEEERVKHIEYLRAQTGLVFLFYRAERRLNELLDSITRVEPEYDFVDEDGVRQIVYVVKERSKIEEIKRAFEEVPAFYIADGHHRAAAAVTVAQRMANRNPNHTGLEEYNYFVGVVFPHDQLKIYDYNRIVKDLNGLTVEQFLNRLERVFNVEVAPVRPYRPKEKHEFGMFLGDTWYRLRVKDFVLREAGLDPVETLDVSILQREVLDKILNIKDPRRDKRIDFVGGVFGLEVLEEYVLKKDWAVAFALYPTSIEELMNVSDAGLIMPPKSTWFEPKLKSGLFVHLI